MTSNVDDLIDEELPGQLKQQDQNQFKSPEENPSGRKINAKPQFNFSAKPPQSHQKPARDDRDDIGDSQNNQTPQAKRLEGKGIVSKPTFKAKAKFRMETPDKGQREVKQQGYNQSKPDMGGRGFLAPSSLNRDESNRNLSGSA